MESPRKESGTTITLKQLIMFAVLFFVAILTAILIYYRTTGSGKKEGKVGREEKAEASSGFFSRLSKKWGGKPSVMKARSEDIKKVLSEWLERIKATEKAKKELLDLCDEFEKKDCSKKTKELMANLREWVNKLPEDDIEFYRALIEVLLSPFL